MEDWLHFVLTFSAYIFLPGTLPPLLQQMWDLLVNVVEHGCRPAGYTDRRSQDAAADLHAYTCLLEQHKFPNSMFTYNLHILTCRLRKQEQARGSISKDLDFPVERVMQDFKAVAGDHPE